VGERVWLITGAGRGLGQSFAEAALARGDAVVATARSASQLDRLAGERLLALDLDVTERAAAQRVVERAVARFGRLDIAVNNAGYAIHAAVEELTEEEIRAQLETNFFGALWVTQAAMAVMRRQGWGHIVNVSSTAGVVGFPLVGAYSASKFALEGMTECLALEAAPFGVHVSILEPSDFRTGFREACRKRAAPIADYEAAFADNLDALSARHAGAEAGDPRRAAAALLDLVDQPAPPLRLALGNAAHERLTAHHRAVLREWEEAEAVARGADG